jgi:methanogenic corrinoid protein MtbC1
MSSGNLEAIANAIGRLDSLENIKSLVSDALSQGVKATEIVERGIRKGLQTVGQKYEADEYFLSELLYAASLVSELIQMLEPTMKQEHEQPEKKDIIVVGTVRGDIHDIGKNIFKTLAECSGFEVRDLGVDIDPSAFTDEILKTRPRLLALSALLTTSLVEMKNTVDAVAAAKVRDNVKIILGGNAVTKVFAQEIGADAAALDAVEGVETCKMWMKK